MIKLEGEIYLNASEVAKSLGIPRHLFYANVKPSIKAHKIKPRKQLLYKQSDLGEFRGIELARKV
ncbi:hypothetical protein KDH_12210 [Dictyobacter sp. S3.2.2.5]|uniref:Helix-turn-helix domain-containing protein n=1 Tax=Dictyobacter halimunensis TaxID=3026934 RepID=A0ABQ6FMY1_9CHLR|nr:hypothetical protein KDH_12210 [Dictyobacter sp. S3.2.2.5]